jgi:hypothetical protein
MGSAALIAGAGEVRGGEDAQRDAEEDGGGSDARLDGDVDVGEIDNAALRASSQSTLLVPVSHWPFELLRDDDAQHP